MNKAFILIDQLKKRGTFKPDEVLFNCLIDACVRFGDIKRAITVFREMEQSSVAPSAVTHGILIKAFGQANQVD